MFKPFRPETENSVREAFCSAARAQFISSLHRWMRSSRPVRHLCSFRRDFVRRPFRLLRGNCGHLFCPIRSALKCAVYRNFRCRAFFSQPVRTCPSLLRADARDVSGIRENYRSGLPAAASASRTRARFSGRLYWRSARWSTFSLASGICTFLPVNGSIPV